MSLRDRLLAVVVAVIWGVNFPMTSLALSHFPPLLLVALRFTLIAIPTLIFIPRPPIKWRYLLGVGFGIGTMQFAFLYLAMDAGLQPGLASIVLQASAPFTVVIAGFWLREKLNRRQVIGIGVAVGALAAIAFHRAQAAALLPVILGLCGALGWAIGNVTTRKAQAPNALHLTLWMSIVAPIPMFALSLVVEGPARMWETFATLGTIDAIPGIIGLLYLVLFATLIGYGIWTTLLAKYPSSTVAPFSMLVPPVGVLSSWIAFGEVPDAVELIAGAVVVAGVLYASYSIAPSSSPGTPRLRHRDAVRARRAARDADRAQGHPRERRKPARAPRG
jgi:O-acetylserine/cysteine efflux transporter